MKKLTILSVILLMVFGSVTTNAAVSCEGRDYKVTTNFDDLNLSLDGRADYMGSVVLPKEAYIKIENKKTSETYFYYNIVVSDNETGDYSVQAFTGSTDIWEEVLRLVYYHEGWFIAGFFYGMPLPENHTFKDYSYMEVDKSKLYKLSEDWDPKYESRELECEDGEFPFLIEL